MPERLTLYGFGCAIDSPVPIPGTTAPPPSPAHGPPLIIDILPARASIVAGEESFSRNGSCIRYLAPAIGQYDCLADSIMITPAIGADPDMVISLLVANALPSAIWLRGQYLLHAAVLHWPECDASFAICGPSGSGKSMLAAQWLDLGAYLIADDVLALGIDGELNRGAGLSGGIYLPRDGNGHRVFRRVSPDQSKVETRLSAILVLQRGPANLLPCIERLPPIYAVEALLQNRHRPVVPALLGRSAEVLAQASAIAKTTPVWRWMRPEGATNLDRDECDWMLAACAAR